MFKAQLDDVQTLSAERRERAAEILTQVGPADAVWASAVGIRPGLHRWTGELLSVALDAALFVIFGLKQAFVCPRPIDFSGQIGPLILTPGHDTWPSGHSTESHLVARVLGELIESHGATAQSKAAFRRLFDSARRIATNREVAGLHFPADSAAGCVLGDALGAYVVALARGDAEGPMQRQFDGPAFYAANNKRPLQDDGSFTGATKTQARTDFELVGCKGEGRVWTGVPPVPPSRRYLGWLWEHASEEWK